MKFNADVFLDSLKSVSQDLQNPRNLAYRFRDESLAVRLAASQVFPCKVNVGQLAERAVLWVKLGERCDDWGIQVQTDVPDVAKSHEEHLGGANIASGIVYVIVGTREEDAGLMQRMIWDYVHEIIRYNFAHWIRIHWADREKSIFETFGYSEWQINPFPEEPTPCPQVTGIVHPTDEGKIVPYSFQDIVDSVSRIKLLNCVPKNIFDVLNRAAKLCIWGYQDWEFFTMSQQYAAMSIETSLTTMYVRSLRRPVHLEMAPRRRNHADPSIVTVDLQDVVTYAEFQAQAYWQERANSGTTYDVLRVNGEPIRELRHRDQNKSILHLFKQREIIAPGESIDLDYLLRKRNYLSHPYGVHIDMMGDALELLHEVVMFINRTWMRFLHPKQMMWENVWLEAPCWAISEGR